MSRSNKVASDTSGRPILVSFGTITISIWALAGFLPIFGLLIQDQSLSHYLIQAAFLGTSAVSIFAIAVTLNLLKGQNIRVVRQARPRLVTLTIYASVWLVAYFAVSVYT
ncbi:MAG: hypothetical protein AAFV54_00080 [Pseudomonadota bacterium]